MVQCFKVKEGTEYAKAVQEHFELRPKWKEVFRRVGEQLGETIKSMVLDTDLLWLEPSELFKEENKKLFTQDGKLRKNTKAAKELGEWYKSLIEELGLTKFRTLSYLITP